MRGRIILQVGKGRVRVAEPFKKIVTDAIAGRDPDTGIAAIEVPESGTGGQTVRNARINVSRVVGDLEGRGGEIEHLRELGVTVPGSDSGSPGVRRFSEDVTFIGNAGAAEVEAAVEASMLEGQESVAFLVTGGVAGEVVRCVSRHMPADVTVIQVEI